MSDTHTLGPIEDERLNDIEQYFMSALSVKIGDFMNESAERVELLDLDTEQPLENTIVYKEYQALVEEELEKYLAEKGMTQEDLVKLVSTCTVREQAAMYCVDYICASTEYAAFMQIVADHRSMYELGGGDGELLGGEGEYEEGGYIDTGDDHEAA